MREATALEGFNFVFLFDLVMNDHGYISRVNAWIPVIARPKIRP